MAAHWPLIPGSARILELADTQSGYVGTQVIAPGDAGLVAGSFWLPAIMADEPLLDPQRRVRTNCHAEPGQWIIADTLDTPVRTPAVQEATALGTAAYAALGVGMYDSLSQVCERFVYWAATYEPDKQRHAVYREAYGLWREIYPHMLSLVEAGLTRPMWRAPGT
jgi:sugar (pentulose or hexulose) kinase